MAVTGTQTTINGVTYHVETENGEILRRFRIPFDQQPLKTRRRAELRECIEEWWLFRAFVDEAVVHSEPAGAITTGRTQQEALYQAARSAYLDWLNA